MHDLIRRAEAALTANPFSPQAGLIQDLLAALKAQQPAPVESEGLPPLPEPDGGADVTEDMGRTMSVVPAWSEPLVRRAQREAMAAFANRALLQPPWADDIEAWLEASSGAEIADAIDRYTLAQVARAEAVERERWMKLCKDAAQRYFSGGFSEAAGACTHLHAQGSAIRQGASHD